MAERSLRDRLVLATKFAFSGAKGNPNASGNGRKNIHRALEGSLRRLKTDYVDLYWLHAWDSVTPAEEVLQTFGDLVRAGKIRYYGLSNVPAWYAAQMATLAAAHNFPAPVALQLQYSLVDRNIEREHASAARAFGLGICPWSPLAGGFLAGKYERQGDDTSANKSGNEEARLSGSNPFGDTKFTERNWRILDVLKKIAAETNRPPAQVALAWVSAQGGVAAPIVGASKREQLVDNLASLEIVLTAEQLRTLDEASDPDIEFTYSSLKAAVFAGVNVEAGGSVN